MSTLTITSTSEEIGAATMSELVALYNSLSGKAPIKKFETRAVGVARCLSLVTPTKPAKNLPATKRDPLSAAAAVLGAGKVSLTEPKVAPKKSSAAPKPAPVAKKAAAKKVPAVKVARPPVPEARGRGAFSLKSVITVVLRDNPHKRGDAAVARYALYRDGMTVEAYLAAGGWRRDVVWDLRNGWISVKS